MTPANSTGYAERLEKSVRYRRDRTNSRMRVPEGASRGRSVPIWCDKVCLYQLLRSELNSLGTEDRARVHGFCYPSEKRLLADLGASGSGNARGIGIHIRPRLATCSNVMPVDSK